MFAISNMMFDIKNIRAQVCLKNMDVLYGGLLCCDIMLFEKLKKTCTG